MACCKAPTNGLSASGQNDVRFDGKQFLRLSAHAAGVVAAEVAAKANIDPQVAAFGPTQLPEFLPDGVEAPLKFLIALGTAKAHADAARPFALLGAHRKRQTHNRAADKRDKFAPLHVPSADC